MPEKFLVSIMIINHAYPGYTKACFSGQQAVKISGVTMNAFPAIIRKGTLQLQLVEAAIFYFGKETESKIYADGNLIETTNLKFGYNAINLGLTPVSKPTLIDLKVVADHTILRKVITLDPVKKWKIKLIQHTHTDIGYTRSQTDILAEHLRPLSQPTMEQRALKESYAWEANRRTASIGEEAMGILQSKFNHESQPSLIVFNTLNWKRSGLATVYIDHQIVPRGKIAGIFDHDGNRLAVQPVLHRSDVTEWAIWLKDIPAFGYKKYIIKAVDDAIQPDIFVANE